jgi:hypothetical protein
MFFLLVQGVRNSVLFLRQRKTERPSSKLLAGQKLREHQKQQIKDKKREKSAVALVEHINA